MKKQMQMRLFTFFFIFLLFLTFQMDIIEKKRKFDFLLGGALDKQFKLS